MTKKKPLALEELMGFSRYRFKRFKNFNLSFLFWPTLPTLPGKCKKFYSVIFPFLLANGQVEIHLKC